MAVIDKPETIEVLRLCALRSALKLEMLGMKRHGPSAYSLVKQEFGFQGNKQKVFSQLAELIEQRRKTLSNM